MGDRESTGVMTHKLRNESCPDFTPRELRRELWSDSDSGISGSPNRPHSRATASVKRSGITDTHPYGVGANVGSQLFAWEIVQKLIIIHE